MIHWVGCASCELVVDLIELVALPACPETELVERVDALTELEARETVVDVMPG